VGLPPGAFVIAADSGADRAAALGLRVDLLIGDLDSATASAPGLIRASGGEVRTYPAEKNATDLELALDAAVALGPARVIVLGGDGGRADHWLGAVLLLASPAYGGVPIEARWESATVTVVRPSCAARLAGVTGDVVTLLPVHGVAVGVRTEGLRYPLRGEDLPPGTTRGVSNEFNGGPATVSLSGGVLLAVVPTP
jgi:thiamine pyrophosphokinase